MKPIVLVSLCFFVSTSCEKRKRDSNLEWAHLKTAASYQGYLISLAPGSSITTCSKEQRDADTFALVLSHWFQVMGRDKHLTITSNCNPRATKILTFVSDSEVNLNRVNYPACDRPTVDKKKILGYQGVDQIVLCEPVSDFNRFHYFAHETGHLIGMCDQYGSDDHFAQFCDAANKSPQVPKSIMGAVSGIQALTSDDIAGVRNLAERTDIPMNATWKALLAGNSGGNNPTPPNPTPTPQISGQCACTHSVSQSTCTVTRADGSFVIAAQQTDAYTCQFFCREGFLKNYLDTCNAQSGVQPTPTPIAPTPTPTPRVTIAPTPAPNACSCAFFQASSSCTIQRQGANYGSAVFSTSSQDCANACFAGALKPTMDQCNTGR